MALCLYDATGLVMTALLPGGEACGSRDCWRATGTNGFRYRDHELTPDGVSRAVLRAGPAGAAKVNVVLKGSNAPVPTPPLALPVIGQLQAANGARWSATYGAASLNDATDFVARSD